MGKLTAMSLLAIHQARAADEEAVEAMEAELTEEVEEAAAEEETLAGK